MTIRRFLPAAGEVYCYLVRMLDAGIWVVLIVAFDGIRGVTGLGGEVRGGRTRLGMSAFAIS